MRGFTSLVLLFIDGNVVAAPKFGAPSSGCTLVLLPSLVLLFIDWCNALHTLPNEIAELHSL